MSGPEYLLNIDQHDAEAKKLAQQQVMAAVKARFAPEFLNRLSAIIMFNSLGTEQLEQIVQKHLKQVRKRLATRGVRVILEKSGAREVLAASYDPNYGARPVERYLESTVVTTLSRMLISGEITSGCVVRIEAAAASADGDKRKEDDSFDSVNEPLSKKARLRYRIERPSNDAANSDDVVVMDVD